MLTTDWGYGARSQRINDLIESKIKDGGKISTDDMQPMQMDNSSEIAKLLVPDLLKINVSRQATSARRRSCWRAGTTPRTPTRRPPPTSTRSGATSSSWPSATSCPRSCGSRASACSVPPADSTGPGRRAGPRLVRECGERDADQAQPDGGDRWFEVVARHHRRPGQRLVDERPRPAARDQTATDTRDELFERAMKDARWELTAKLGKDIDTWSWGRLHQLTLKNQTLGTEGPGFVQWLLNRGPWNLSGGEAAVDATGWNAAGGYGVIWVPSMRMVVNLGDLDKSRWINLTGASGHAFSAHYTDQTGKWAKGELLDWSFSDDAVDEQHERQLALSPERRSANSGPAHARASAPSRGAGGLTGEAAHPRRGDHRVHRAVVRLLAGPRSTTSCVVQQHHQRRVGARAPQPGQHAVVRAAAAPQPHPAPVHREPRQQDGVRAAVTASGPRRSPAGSSRPRPAVRTSAPEPPGRTRPSRGRCPAAGPAAGRARPRARRASSSARVPGSVPTETYAATVRRVRQLGQVQRAPRPARRRPSRTSSAVNPLLTARSSRRNIRLSGSGHVRWLTGRSHTAAQLAASS